MFNIQKCFHVKAQGDLTLLGIVPDLELKVDSHLDRLMKPAIYKV